MSVDHLLLCAVCQPRSTSSVKGKGSQRAVNGHVVILITDVVVCVCRSLQKLFSVRVKLEKSTILPQNTSLIRVPFGHSVLCQEQKKKYAGRTNKQTKIIYLFLIVRNNRYICVLWHGLWGKTQIAGVHV